MLSIIVPTYNEVGALPILACRLDAALRGARIEYRLVVVDDNSPDGTGQLADELAKQYPIIAIHRPRKAGLADAVLEGLYMTEGEIVGVMDADLSHPPEVVPEMVRAVMVDDVDLAVGSRYVRGGGIEGWPARRRIVSAVANILTKWLTPIRDATSGFFVIRRNALEQVELNPIGFKIGLEVMARANYRQFVEVPYVFTDRKQGSSKFGLAEIGAFLKQLAILYVGRCRTNGMDRRFAAVEEDLRGDPNCRPARRRTRAA